MALACACRAERQYFVAPSGSDSNSGTKTSPFKTWIRAQRAVKASKGAGAATVFFRAGDYVLNQSVKLGVEDSGTSGAPVTFKNFADERVTFRSGVSLGSTAWAPVDASSPYYSALPQGSHGNVLVAKLPGSFAGKVPPRFMLDNSNGARATSAVKNVNSVYGMAGEGKQNTSTVWYVGQRKSVLECRQTVAASSELEVVAYAWHDPSVFGEPWAEGCYARLDFYGAVSSRAFVPQEGVTSGAVAPLRWQRQAGLDITPHVTTAHRGEDFEVYAPAMDKRKLKLGVSVESLIGKQQASDPGSLELKVVQSDFNMGIVPVQSLPTPTSFLTTTPTAFRMGADPNFRMGRARVPSTRLNGSDGTSVAPTHWIMNVVAGIDGPGAYAYVRDQSGTSLLYWPAFTNSTNGLVMPTEVWVPSLAELVLVEGKASNATTGDNPAHHITFSGLVFTGGDRYCWGGRDSGGIQHAYSTADAPDALLRLRTATDISVQACTFERSGGVGVRMDLLAMRNSVTGCEFSRLGLQGIVVVGYGAGKKDVSRENTVAGCNIHHTGRDKYDAPGIVLWHTAFNNITANHVHHTPSKALLIGGIRSLLFDPTPFEHKKVVEGPESSSAAPPLTIHEGTWLMTRWDEIPQSDRVKITGTEENSALDPPVGPGDGFATDRRYVRWNCSTQ
jgi:hypothetical protein